MESKFSQIIKIALKEDSTDLIRDLFYIQDKLTEDLGIKYSSNVGMLELLIRVLVRVDLDLKQNLTFTIVGCPEDEQEFMTWFTKFFMLLESLEETGYELNEEHKSILYSEYSPFREEMNLKPNYNEFKIEFKN